ncbi:serine--tRNA ligase [Patescibacteria group bacterium]|nr:serine--tRNA ligase [Patescibacteria group bacterium]MCL5091731.1 serine--tRNA ligase [Patescibacteria group bacterium]
MLSIEYIRANKNKVANAAKNKNRNVDVDKIVALDDKRRQLTRQSQSLRQQRNELAKKPFTESIRQQGKQIKDDLRKIENDLLKVENEMNQLVAFVPNVPLDNVPIGKDATGNAVIKTWGEPTVFDFTPLSHIDLGRKLDLFNLERGTKVSGFRGYFLKNAAAQLHLALLMYGFNRLVDKGYVPMIAPALVKEFAFFGSGHFPWSQDDVYQTNEPGLYLSGTAEVPVMAYYSGETFDKTALPKKIVALSPCFRKEAGSYGKDTHGLYRVHEFWKVEQVIIAQPDLEEAKRLHQELQENTETMLQELGLPYRVMMMCTGEMGEPQIFKHDTEVWMPSRQSYGEVASNSILGDFQSRRLKIKCRRPDGKTEFCYSLNNTALASPRLLIALLENHQQADGSINLPAVLHHYLGKKVIKAPESATA